MGEEWVRMGAVVTSVPQGRRIGSHRAIPTRRNAMRTTRTLAAALLTAAALASPASAMPIDPPHKPAKPPMVQTAASSDETSSGFDWSSAGIGATGGVGAFAIALAGIAGTRRRRLTNPASTATA
jgi:hypothetical protein